MRPFILFLSCILFCLNQPFPAKAQEIPTPFLWRAAAPESQLYIMGIVPGAETEIQENPIYGDYFKNVTALVLTNHPDSLAYQYQRLYTEKGFYKAQDHLQNHLCESTFAALEKKLDELGSPGLGHHPRMKPWLIAQTLNRLEFKQAELDSDKMFRSLMSWANQQGWAVFSLQNYSSFMKALPTLSDTEQIQYLENILKSDTERKSYLETLYSYWKNDKKDKIFTFAQKEKTLLPQQLVTVETAKNQEWKSKIQELLNQGEAPLFIVDLSSSNTLKEFLQDLQKAGMKISKLPNE